jgi:hypothetical protein
VTGQNIVGSNCKGVYILQHFAVMSFHSFDNILVKELLQNKRIDKFTLEISDKSNRMQII